MDINKSICDIKEKYYKNRFKIFGSTYFETQEYRDNNFSHPELDEYVIGSSKNKLFETILIDIGSIIFLILVTYKVIPDIFYSFYVIIYIIIWMYLIRNIINHIYYYNNPKNILKINKEWLQISDQIIIKWELVLALHFFEYHARGQSIFKLLIHYIDEHTNIKKKEVNLKYLNFNSKQICNILSKYYLYENVYRTHY